MQEHTKMLDVLCVGLGFLDINLAGLPDSGPTQGEEIWTADWAVHPGGVANFALTVAHLEGRAALATVVGDDPIGNLFVSECERFGIDCSPSLRAEGWRQPVTAALTWQGDRALVTGGTPPPISLDAHLVQHLPPAATAVVHLAPERPDWMARATADGMRVIAQVGWDPTGLWDAATLRALPDCWAFLPNEAEALAYARTDDLRTALDTLCDLVETVVVTRGERGAIAMDATGRTIEMPALPVRAVDATGAGDMFASAFALASARGCSLGASLRLATTTASLGVARSGGASTAPTLTEVLAALDADPDARAHAEEITHHLSTTTQLDPHHLP